MTNCAECLSAMSTSRLSDVEPGSAIALHCATCANCSRVAEEVRYAEYRLATALNEQRSAMDPSDLTVAAMKGSERLRRLRVGRWIQSALLVAGCYVFFVFMEQRTKVDTGPLDPALPGALVDADGIATRTVTLRCITPEQAIALATPYLRSKAAVYTVPGIPAVIVRGKREEFQARRQRNRPVRRRVSASARNDSAAGYFPRQTRKGLRGVPFHQSFMLSERAMAKCRCGAAGFALPVDPT